MSATNDNGRAEGRLGVRPAPSPVRADGRQWALIIVLVLLAASATAETGKGTTMTTIALPPPRTDGSLAVEAALARRRSVRNFADRPLSLAQLGQILWAAQGITGNRWPMRTAPSAGALYPLEVLVVAGQVNGLADGIYRYRPGKHDLRPFETGDHRETMARAALGQGWMAQAPVTLAITGITARTAAKYGRRAERYVYMEAGHAAQNVYLQAQADGLGTTAVGAFRDNAVRALLGLSEDETPLYLMPVGVPR
ncbi:MAG: SagB/ThcOx family dehydrogenase [Desulfobacterales bacterium]|nr:SagB/ThcOx family dehydrogenase [Desulfobacterales bacterium]